MLAFHALSDPTRQRIVELLAARGRLRAGELVAACGASGPAISQHLKVLREARLVGVEPVAQARIYFLDPQGLVAAAHWIAHQVGEWQQRFDALDELLRQPAATSPKPKPSPSPKPTPRPRPKPTSRPKPRGSRR